MADAIASNAHKTATDLPPLPAKRSLFKKSQWAKPIESGDAVDMFSRAKELFPTVAADSERRRKEKKRKSDSEKIEQEAKDEGKKMRVSTNDEQSSASMSEYRTDSSTNTLLTSPKPKVKESPSKNSQTSSSSHVEFEKDQKPPSIISLGDSSDEESSMMATRPTVSNFDDYDDFDSDIEQIKPPQPVPEAQVAEEIFEEDDPFAEFVIKAREAAKRATPFTRLPLPGSTNVDSPSSGSSAATRPSTFQFRAAEPIINILVTSQIAGTMAVSFKRKLSQRIKDVRVNWCDRQVINGRALEENEKRDIFLTFRGTRLFDVSTGKSIGLQVNAAGNICLGGPNGNVYADGRIHLEAWTEELFTEFEKQRRLDQQRRAHNPLDELEAEEDEPEPQPDATPDIRIIIKAKGLEEFKVMVKPHTLIDKLIHAFKSKRKLPPESEVVLRFDGDKLEPQSMVGDADLEDMSSVDAYVN